jgi:hypothetical protein
LRPYRCADRSAFDDNSRTHRQSSSNAGSARGRFNTVSRELGPAAAYIRRYCWPFCVGLLFARGSQVCGPTLIRFRNTFPATLWPKSHGQADSTGRHLVASGLAQFACEFRSSCRGDEGQDGTGCTFMCLPYEAAPSAASFSVTNGQPSNEQRFAQI